MVDPMVQATQEWLNSTYGQASWYEAIPPDRMGKTGWTTMFALTRALQYELNIDISLISDSFGPTTLERFAVDVGVVSSATKPNIIKILQGALWCKGYTGGPIDGTYSPQTQIGVTDACVDMGFTTRLEVDARVMKALLTMDAYVVVLGGSEEIRAVQQWMNRTYRDHVNYAIIPCDGHYSRYVQKMLVYAIQWALNVSGANGNYGPGTRNAVRTSGAVQQSNTGRLVQLFIAALYFNGYSPGGFGDTFTAAVASEVRKMQAFEHLPITGKGDYATWSSLLVSNGDPLRPVTGVDTRFWITPEIATDLKANGFIAVGRYLANSKVANPLDKKLRPGEVETIINAGLALFPIWQMSGTSADHFSGSQAILDADEATTAAEGYGIPHGSIIYFAVDFDAIDLDIDSNVLPYFRTLNNKMRQKGTPYLVGVYGSRNVCTRVSQEAGVVSSFVSGMSTGFSGNLGFPLPQNWAFNQINETNLVLNGKNYYQNGTIVAVDNDVVSGRDLGVRSLVISGDPSESFFSFVDAVYAQAKIYRDSHEPSGGEGYLTKLTFDYLRHWTYDDLAWTATAGSIDQYFVSQCDSTVAPIEWTYANARHGLSVGMEHTAATAIAILTQGIFQDHTRVNQGDLAGWAGDLGSVIKHWRAEAPTQSLFDYATAQIGHVDSTTSFSLEDLISDCDGYNIATAPGAYLPSRVRDVLAKSRPNTVARFFDSRFDGSHSTLRAAVQYLAQSDDFPIQEGRGDIPLSDAETLQLQDAFDQSVSLYL